MLFQPSELDGSNRREKIERFVESLRDKKRKEAHEKALADTNKAVKIAPTRQHLPERRSSTPIISRQVAKSTIPTLNTSLGESEYPPLSKPSPGRSRRNSTLKAQLENLKLSPTKVRPSAVAQEKTQRLAEIQKATQQRVKEMQTKAIQESARRKEQEEMNEIDKIEAEKALKLMKARARLSRAEEGLNERETLQLHRAKCYYTRQLLVRRGFSPWRNYIEICRYNQSKAESFRRRHLCQSAWSLLSSFLQLVRHERAVDQRRKTLLAGGHYKMYLLQRVFKEWKQLRRVVRAKADAVRRHFRGYLLKKIALQAWRIALEATRRRFAKRLVEARAYSEKNCQRRCWTAWLEYIEESRLDREAQNKASQTWSRAQRMLYQQQS